MPPPRAPWLAVRAACALALAAAPCAATDEWKREAGLATAHPLAAQPGAGAGPAGPEIYGTQALAAFADLGRRVDRCLDVVSNRTRVARPAKKVRGKPVRGPVFPGCRCCGAVPAVIPPTPKAPGGNPLLPPTAPVAAQTLELRMRDGVGLH
jgi:hypothetical protein